MRKAKRGSIIVVGATASLVESSMTTAFAASKAAQRSLAQSLARQFWPEGIHTSLLIIDGSIGDAAEPAAGEAGKRLDPRAIARGPPSRSSARNPSAWSSNRSPPEERALVTSQLGGFVGAQVDDPAPTISMPVSCDDHRRLVVGRRVLRDDRVLVAGEEPEVAAPLREREGVVARRSPTFGT